VANEENLKPWVPGQSGNPAGKPKGVRNRATIIKEILELRAVKSIADKQGQILGAETAEAAKTIGDQVVLALVGEAMKGDVAAVKELHDSVFGKLTDHVKTEHTFTQMGRVTAEPAPDAPDAAEGDKQAQPLDFNVGDPVTSEPQE